MCGVENILETIMFRNNPVPRNVSVSWNWNEWGVAFIWNLFARENLECIFQQHHAESNTAPSYYRPSLSFIRQRSSQAESLRYTSIKCQIVHDNLPKNGTRPQQNSRSRENFDGNSRMAAVEKLDISVMRNKPSNFTATHTKRNTNE